MCLCDICFLNNGARFLFFQTKPKNLEIVDDIGSMRPGQRAKCLAHLQLIVLVNNKA